MLTHKKSRYLFYPLDQWYFLDGDLCHPCKQVGNYGFMEQIDIPLVTLNW